MAVATAAAVISQRLTDEGSDRDDSRARTWRTTSAGSDSAGSATSTRCVGANGDVEPDLYFGSLRPGDVVLLASDGLTGMLDDDQLLRILQTEGGPDTWVDRLISEANRRGGLDNITAIVIRIDEIDPPTGEHPAAQKAAAAGR